jgi:hypothetical protein
MPELGEQAMSMIAQERIRVEEAIQRQKQARLAAAEKIDV